MLYVAPIQPLLSSMAQRRDVMKAAQSEGGVALTEVPLSARVLINQDLVDQAALRFNSSATPPKIQVVFLRLVSEDDPDKGSRFHRLQLMDSKRGVLFEYSFPGYPWPPKPDEPTPGK